MKEPFVSVIIPLYVICERFFNDLEEFNKLSYSNFEIIIVCDKKVTFPIINKNIKLILTHKRQTGPAEKRDLGIKYARGEICAFIDDDAYPHPNWIKNSVKDLKDPYISAVGGPGMTPSEDDFWEQLTGLIYSSFFCGGFAQYRFVKGEKKYVVDYPAYNLLVRTEVLKKVGGYGNYFYGGEDTFLCLKIIKTGYKIIYDPEVVVYHHRRALFIPYLKQIANVGKHRGYFAKKFPETSRQMGYFIPSLLAIGFFTSAFLSFFDYRVKITFIILILISLFLGFLSVIGRTTPWKSLIVALGIILTHLTYGSYFIKGLLTHKLER